MSPTAIYRQPHLIGNSELLNAMTAKKSVLESLLNAPLKIVNVGLMSFADDLENREVDVVHVDWSPSQQADSKLSGLLSKLGS